MPNWCYTQIIIKDERKKLEEFEALVKKWTGTDFMENGFGLNWLGNIVGNAEIGTINISNETDLSCRGRLIGLEISDNGMLIETETAWGPMLKMWVTLFEKYLPEAEYYYQADESGEGLYLTDNPDLADKYIIYSDVIDIDYDDEANEGKVEQILKECLNITEEDFEMEAALAFLNDMDEPILYVNKWDFVPIMETY